MFQPVEQPKNDSVSAARGLKLRILDNRIRLKVTLPGERDSHMKWKIATFNVNGVRSREQVVIVMDRA